MDQPIGSAMKICLLYKGSMEILKLLDTVWNIHDNQHSIHLCTSNTKIYEYILISII